MKFLTKAQELLREFYHEKGEGQRSERQKEEVKLEASLAEIFLFLFTLILFLVYMFNILWWEASFITGGNLIAKRLIPLIPTLLWAFMRASRKDMNAAAALVAGLFGGGAIGALLTRLSG